MEGGINRFCMKGEIIEYLWKEGRINRISVGGGGLIEYLCVEEGRFNRISVWKEELIEYLWEEGEW